MTKNPSSRQIKTDPVQLDRKAVQRFRIAVYDHYFANPRPLPWRYTENPYHILVSEIMLQQTRVERVTGKYHEFLKAFPDFAALARAPIRDVLRAWQGLGYNRRAISLQETAKIVARDFSGILPETPEQLRALPGIGAYTAAAIAAFAFHRPVPLIETNVRAVFIHCFFHDRQDVRDREIMPLVQATIDTTDPRTWYYALMDYGVMLKRTHPNPSRKSAHHVRQTRFEGSDRQVRGKILRLLLLKPRSRKRDIPQALGETPERVSKILKDLEKEGFISRKGAHYAIAE